jgi:polysaccharide biosynthesis protein PslH
MKLLILSTKLPYPPKDGGAIATLGLSTGLAAAGIDVTMLTLNTRKHFFPPDQIPESIRNTINFHTADTDTSVRPLRAVMNLLFSRRPYIAERFDNRRFNSLLKELIMQEEFDIVQLEGPYLDASVPLIRKHSRAKIALRAHNVEHEIWERKWKNEGRFLLRLYYRNLAKRVLRLERRLINGVDLLVPISDRDGQRLLAFSKNLQSITIPAGIDLAGYPENSVKSTHDICFIGALDWIPNQEGLLWFNREVLPHLHSSSPSVKIHIAGRNAPESFVKKLTHPAIHFHGEVEDAGNFLEPFSIMAVPLLSGSGMRIKILEGMARGMCIVTTAIGAEGIPATDGKDILIAGNGRQFAENLLRLMHDPALARSVSVAARQMIKEKFDTFAIAGRLADTYKKMA